MSATILTCAVNDAHTPPASVEDASTLLMMQLANAVFPYIDVIFVVLISSLQVNLPCPELGA